MSRTEETPALFMLGAPRRPGRPRKVAMRPQLDASILAAQGEDGHLRAMDAAMVEAARILAVRIDDTDDDKLLTQLLGQLVSVLDRLGLSPKGRRQLELERPSEGVNPFDAVRDYFDPEDEPAAGLDA